MQILSLRSLTMFDHWIWWLTAWRHFSVMLFCWPRWLKLCMLTRTGINIVQLRPKNGNFVKRWRRLRYLAPLTQFAAQLIRNQVAEMAWEEDARVSLRSAFRFNLLLIVVVGIWCGIILFIYLFIWTLFVSIYTDQISCY